MPETVGTLGSSPGNRLPAGLRARVRPRTIPTERRPAAGGWYRGDVRSAANGSRQAPGRCRRGSRRGSGGGIHGFGSHVERAERYFGTGDIPNFFRKPYGDGWALAGDAGYHKDPCTAQGISDAFRSAEWLADAIHAGDTGATPGSAAQPGGDGPLFRNAGGHCVDPRILRAGEHKPDRGRDGGPCRGFGRITVDRWAGGTACPTKNAIPCGPAYSIR